MSNNKLKLMSKKYLDRNLASRTSLTRSTSPSLLPPISSHHPDSFTLSLKRHLTRTQNNPEQHPPHSIRYYIENQLMDSSRKEKTSIAVATHERRPSLINRSELEPYRMSLPAHLKQKPDSEIYAEKVQQNIKHYGKGMLRRRHLNSLSVSSKERDLLELHYRLKKQREKAIIEKEAKKGHQQFKELMSRYDSL